MPEMSEAERAEAFREFHAEHLRRQTKSIDTIKTILLAWFWLSVAGAVILVASFAAETY